MGACGGRLDQALSAIHELTKYSYSHPQAMITLMDKNSLMLFLRSGQNTIDVSKTLMANKGCGFFPSSEKVKEIKTTGLRWNMGNSDSEVKSLDWKEFVSSSNEIVDDQIVV